jgi:hypothetical protein
MNQSNGERIFEGGKDNSQEYVFTDWVSSEELYSRARTPDEFRVVYAKSKIEELVIKTNRREVSFEDEEEMLRINRKNKLIIDRMVGQSILNLLPTNSKYFNSVTSPLVTEGIYTPQDLIKTSDEELKIIWKENREKFRFTYLMRNLAIAESKVRSL